MGIRMTVQVHISETQLLRESSSLITQLLFTVCVIIRNIRDSVTVHILAAQVCVCVKGRLPLFALEQNRLVLFFVNLLQAQ